MWEEENMIVDVFLFRENIELNKTRLQEGEVINIKWVEKEEIKNMFKRNEMVEPLKYVYELIEDGII